MYVLTTAKLDATRHWWVASLANYNFPLYYRGGEGQHQCRCLVECVLAHVHALCLGHPTLIHCSRGMSNARGCPQGPKSPTQVYSCDLCVIDMVEDSLQVALQRCRMGPWASAHTSQMTHLSSSKSFRNATTSIWCRASCAEKLYKKDLRGTVSVGIVSYAQDNHSGRMPWWGQPLWPQKNTQPDVWPFLLSQIGCTDKGACQKCCQCITFKARQQKTPMESIVATHPLELVHINYLCLEPEKERRRTFWWWLTTLPSTPRHMLLDCRWPRQQPRYCGTISLSITGCQKRSFWTNGGTLRVN